MYTFLLMVSDYVKTHNLHFFMLFYLFIMIRWAVIFFPALRYRKYNGAPGVSFFTSVIIPVVDEDPELFRDVMTRILSQRPDEVIVVINGPENPALKEIVGETAAACNETPESKSVRTECLYTPIPGKRNAIRLGMEQVSENSDITILVDSDTIWTENTLEELLKPFSEDEAIGGVTTRQKILNARRTLTTRVAAFLEEIRAEGTMKAMSVTGKVGCLPGRTIAFRTSILKDAMEEFMTETFMGIHKEVSDDRSLTNITLKKGYKTVMQDSSLVYTDAPLTWKKFLRQQLRWAEGSQYNNLRMTRWMFKNAPLMCFIFWTDMLMPLLLIGMYANIFLCFLARTLGFAVNTINYTEPLVLTLVLILFGAVFGFGARNIKVLIHQPLSSLLLLPFMTLFLSLVMAPLRLLGLMRCADDLDWGTRQLVSEPEETAGPEHTPPEQRQEPLKGGRS